MPTVTKRNVSIRELTERSDDASGGTGGLEGGSMRPRAHPTKNQVCQTQKLGVVLRSSPRYGCIKGIPWLYVDVHVSWATVGEIHPSPALAEAAINGSRCRRLLVE